jgi:predicted acyltransferase
VKKLWSPSWALFSGGYAIGLLALFYWIIDVKKWNKWVFPFVIVGLNPLAMYLMGMLSKEFVRANLHRHLPDFVFVGPVAPIVEACLIALIFWLVLWWMFRNKVFLRL